MEIGKEVIETRVPIWTAISEFYIDTELTDDDLNRILKVFIESGLRIKTIKEIDLFEVFPLLKMNGLSPTPSWAGFDEKWLSENCAKQYKRRDNWLHMVNCRIWNKLFYNMRKRYWVAIEVKLEKTAHNNPYS